MSGYRLAFTGCWWLLWFDATFGIQVGMILILWPHTWTITEPFRWVIEAVSHGKSSLMRLAGGKRSKIIYIIYIYILYWHTHTLHIYICILFTEVKQDRKFMPIDTLEHWLSWGRYASFCGSILRRATLCWEEPWHPAANLLVGCPSNPSDKSRPGRAPRRLRLQFAHCCASSQEAMARCVASHRGHVHLGWGYWRTHRWLEFWHHTPRFY